MVTLIALVIGAFIAMLILLAWVMFVVGMLFLRVLTAVLGLAFAAAASVRIERPE